MQRFAPGNYDPDQDIWELYHLPDDFSQANNLAAEHPDKLAELQQLWWQEAERNRVLPLLGGLAVMFGDLPPLPTTTRFAFQGDVHNIQRGMVPRIFGRSYAIEGRLHIPDSGAQGVIVANADFMGGFALWVDEQQRLRHTYSFLGVETYRQVSNEPLPVTVRMLFETAQPVVGSGRHGDAVGRRPIDRCGSAAPNGEPVVYLVRRDGHRPRQRAGARPRLPGQGAKGSSSTSSRWRPMPRWCCTSTPLCRRSDRARRVSRLGVMPRAVRGDAHADEVAGTITV